MRSRLSQDSIPVVFDIDVVIPSNDTSGITFQFSTPGYRDSPWTVSWVSVGDSVEFWKQNVRAYAATLGASRIPRQLYIRQITDTIELAVDPNWREKYPNGKEVVGYYEKDRSFVVVREHPILRIFTEEDRLRQYKGVIDESQWVKTIDERGTALYIYRDDYPIYKRHLDSLEATRQPSAK